MSEDLYPCEFILDPNSDEDESAQKPFRRGRGLNWSMLTRVYGRHAIVDALGHLRYADSDVYESRKRSWERHTKNRGDAR